MAALGRIMMAGASALVLALASPAWSAEAAPSTDNLALARRYMAAVHLDQQMDGMMRTMIPVMTAQLAKTSNLTPEQQRIVTEIATESARDMMGKLTERMTPLFAQTFSTRELQDLVAFYEGPSGQSMMAKMPQLMKSMTPMMLELMPQMQADMKARLCARIDCKALAKPAAAPTPS